MVVRELSNKEQTVVTATTAGKIDLDAVFKALASSHRREVIQMLSEADHGSKTCCAAEEVCACKISDRLGVSPPTTSHHMSVLRDAGLVSARKDGLWTYYTLNRDVLEEVAQELRSL